MVYLRKHEPYLSEWRRKRWFDKEFNTVGFLGTNVVGEKTPEKKCYISFIIGRYLFFFCMLKICLMR